MRQVLAGLALVLTIASPPVSAQGAEDPYDFALSEDFVRGIKNANSILYSMQLKMGEHSAVHPLASDCEMHIAGEPATAFANPPGVVVEPPNVCKNKAPKGSKTWAQYVNKKIVGKNCTAVGYPRIFTEHASGGSGASNPDHVFELHPLTSISCDGVDLDLKPLLKVYKGMRHVKDTTADLCLKERELSVRRKNGMLEFREAGGGSCGNFGVVSLSLYKKEWVHSIGGGHAAIVRGRVGAFEPFDVKAYTLEGTKADQIFADAQSGSSLKERQVLGVITYDFFNIIRALDNQHAPEGKWIRVDYPIALVLFGASHEAVVGND